MSISMLCDYCITCPNPTKFCSLLPVMAIYLDDESTPSYDFEVIEDALRDTLNNLRHQGRIESIVTGNTTTFGG